MSQDHTTVSIHIGKEEVKSPNPTTGKALFQLGKVDPAKYDLFREVHGPGDDEQIFNTDAPVTLKDGDHFFTSPTKLNPGI